MTGFVFLSPKCLAIEIPTLPECFVVKVYGADDCNARDYILKADSSEDYKLWISQIFFASTDAIPPQISLLPDPSFFTISLLNRNNYPCFLCVQQITLHSVVWETRGNTEIIEKGPFCTAISLDRNAFSTRIICFRIKNNCVDDVEVALIEESRGLHFENFNLQLIEEKEIIDEGWKSVSYQFPFGLYIKSTLNDQLDFSVWSRIKDFFYDQVDLDFVAHKKSTLKDEELYLSIPLNFCRQSMMWQWKDGRSGVFYSLTSGALSIFSSNRADREQLLSIQAIQVIYYSILDCIKAHQRVSKEFLDHIANYGFLFSIESLISLNSDEVNLIADIQFVSKFLSQIQFKMQDDEFNIKTIDDKITLIIPSKYSTKYISVTCVLFVQAINEYSLFSNDLQRSINLESIDKLLNYAPPQFHDEIEELKAFKSRLSFLTQSQRICRELFGGRLTSCKSGKDRTSMSTTLEQCTVIFEGLKEQQDIVLHTLRDFNGLRMQNVFKNVDWFKYAFNRIQYSTLPELLRPPSYLINK